MELMNRDSSNHADLGMSWVWVLGLQVGRNPVRPLPFRPTLVAESVLEDFRNVSKGGQASMACFSASPGKVVVADPCRFGIMVACIIVSALRCGHGLRRFLLEVTIEPEASAILARVLGPYPVVPQEDAPSRAMRPPTREGLEPEVDADFARSVIGRLGGEFGVEEASNRPSCRWIRLPFAAAHAAEGRLSSHPGPEGGLRLPRLGSPASHAPAVPGPQEPPGGL